MHRMMKGLAAFALVAATAGTAEAQGGFGFGLHAGAAIPTGDLGDFVGTGFQVGGEVGFNPAALPFGVRIDVDYNRWSFDQDVTTFGGNTRIISGTANALFKIPATMISPYLIGGIGAYNGKDDVDDVEGEESSTEFGFQIGGGLGFNLSGFETAIEIKLVNVFTEDDPDTGEGTSARYIPITFRIMFGGAGGGTPSGMRRK